MQETTDTVLDTFVSWAELFVTSIHQQLPINCGPLSPQLLAVTLVGACVSVSQVSLCASKSNIDTLILEYGESASVEGEAAVSVCLLLFLTACRCT